MSYKNLLQQTLITIIQRAKLPLVHSLLPRDLAVLPPDNMEQAKAIKTS